MTSDGIQVEEAVVSSVKRMKKLHVTLTIEYDDSVMFTSIKKLPLGHDFDTWQDV